eukprot:6188858-Pleurochrysis_carterae.AAC.1
MKRSEESGNARSEKGIRSNRDSASGQKGGAKALGSEVAIGGGGSNDRWRGRVAKEELEVGQGGERQLLARHEGAGFCQKEIGERRRDRARGARLVGVRGRWRVGRLAAALRT